MASQPTYLIIGGCGFLGHHIVSQLLDTHTAQVAVLDLRTERNRLSGVSYFDADITSQKDVLQVLRQVNPMVLIHTASPVAVYTNKALFEKVNIKGTQNLLECAAQIDSIKAFVFTSSASVVYDGVNGVLNVDETYPILRHPQQTVYYSHTKGIAEEMVLAANGKHHNMLTVALRPSGIFGEGDAQALPGLLEAYHTGKHKWQLGDGSNGFDPTYVGNVAHAHLLAARALLQTQNMGTPPLDHEKVDGEAFNVTNDEPMPFWDFARLVWKEAGWKGSKKDAIVIPRTVALMIAVLLEWVYWIFTFGTKQPMLQHIAVVQSTANRTFDITKAKRRLGYMPLLSVRDGVKRGVKWFEEQEKSKGKQEEQKKSR